MKFRLATIIALIWLLTACNYTLAEDITPPPDYVPPTPGPTLGPLHPPQAPSTVNGAAIYAEKCAPCHGETGLGDGEQGIQLGVTVPALGLPEIARPASPAQWYSVVTQGNMERFMPPFASLSDQERWDVVAYTMTLHTTGTEVESGRQIFEASCADCPTDFFQDQSKMAGLSEVELARIIMEGSADLPAFGQDLTQEQVWAAAAYLRTLAFDSVPLAVGSTPATQETDEPLAANEPSVAAEAEAGIGTVTGSVENRSGANLSSDLTVTLRGFEHGADPSTGPQEVLTRQGAVREDGSFAFEDVEIPENRIFVAELIVDGTEYQSGFAIVPAGASDVILPPITLYPKTTDTSGLVMDEVRIFVEYGTDNIQVYNVYSFRNPSEEIIVVSLTANNEIPFLKAPDGAAGFGYEPMQGSESFLQAEDGFAIPPSEGTYGLIAFSSIPKEKKLEYSQSFVLPAAVITLFLPEGVEAEGAQLTDQGVQAIQNFNFQIYEVDAVRAGDTISFTISGSPMESGEEAAAETGFSRNLLIGAGALGLVLILGGVWMHHRSRKSADVGLEAGSDEFETPEDVMDAIIAVDDLHRAGKITDAAHQKRRSELKEILREML